MAQSEAEKMVDIFDGVPSQDRPLDGIMGNADYNDFEMAEAKKLLEMPGLFETQGSVLDVGCGIGRFIKPLKDAGFKNVVGIDFSREMLKVACEKNSGVEFHRADLAEKLPFADDEFDCSFVMYVFIHILDDDRLNRAISEIERVTKNDIVIIQDMDPVKARNEYEQVNIREVFDLILRFKRKGLKKFLKNIYTLPIGDDKVNVSMLVMGGERTGY